MRQILYSILIAGFLVSCSSKDYEYMKFEQELESFKEYADEQKLFSNMGSGGSFSSTLTYNGDCTGLFEYIEKYSGEKMFLSSSSSQAQSAFDSAKQAEIESKK